MMVAKRSNRWLALIHHIPPKPNSLRVKIWRRLQQIGAAAIKQSVYVMPACEQSREDLSWTLKAIVDGGGDGSISEVRFLEGLTDAQVIALFQNARKSDYEKLIQEAHQLLATWSAEATDPRNPAAKARGQVAKLQRQLDSIASIDFFKAPERGTADMLVKDLAARLSVDGPVQASGTDPIDALKGKVWVTRQNLFVDRLACGWLICRFIDPSARFKFVDSDRYTPKPGEIRFDMFEGEYTHEGDRCTFEVMLKRLGLKERGLPALAEVIHDIDLKDNKYKRPETDGLNALLTGLAASQPDDAKRMEAGGRLLDSLYAYFKRIKGR
jgi:hypothetical protein